MKLKFESYLKRLSKKLNWASNAIYPNAVTSKLRRSCCSNYNFCNFSVEATEKYCCVFIEKTGFRTRIQIDYPPDATVQNIS